MRPKCGMLLNEKRTPGNNHAPDGPPESWQSVCELSPGHEEPHDWHVWHRVYA